CSFRWMQSRHKRCTDMLSIRATALHPFDIQDIQAHDGSNHESPRGGQTMAVATCNSTLPHVGIPTCTVQHVLKGQKALVTGANSGIGLGVALALGRAGADVVVNYISNDETAQQVVEEIQQHDVRAYAHQADVSKEGQVQAMFQRMFDK